MNQSAYNVLVFFLSQFEVVCPLPCTSPKMKFAVCSPEPQPITTTPSSTSLDQSLDMPQGTLLSIPLEIRLHILHHYLNQVTCYVSGPGFSPYENGDLCKIVFYDGSQRGDLSLLRTCQQIRSECLPIVSSTVILNIQSAWEMRALCDVKDAHRNYFLRAVASVKIRFFRFIRPQAAWTTLLKSYPTIGAVELISTMPITVPLRGVSRLLTPGLTKSKKLSSRNLSQSSTWRKPWSSSASNDRSA